MTSINFDSIQYLNQISPIESKVQGILTRINDLQHATTRLEDNTIVLYDKLRALSKELELTSAKVTTLRGLLRLLQLSNKIQASDKDLARVAHSVHVAEQLLVLMNFEGISLVKTLRTKISIEHQNIRISAEKILDSGLESLSISESGTALQIFYNLGELTLSIVNALARLDNLASIDFKSVFNVASLSKDPNGARAALWKRFESALDYLLKLFLQSLVLQRSLAKRDPATRKILQEILSRSTSDSDLHHPIISFWHTIYSMIIKEINKGCSSNMIKNVFAKESNRLKSLLSKFCIRARERSASEGGLPTSSDENKLINAILSIVMS